MVVVADAGMLSASNILESARVTGTGTAARSRRVVYQRSFTWNKPDDRTINLVIAGAERTATGQVPLKKVRFPKISGATRAL